MPEEGIVQYEIALQIDPDSADANNNIGNALLQLHRVDEAVAHYKRALELQPGDADAYNDLGNALLIASRPNEALPEYRRALQLRPDFPAAHANLGRALLKTGQTAEAIAQYETALKLQPGNPGFLNALAWVLATCPDPGYRDGGRATALAQQAYRQAGDSPAILRTLAAAHAQAGHFPEAVEAARRASEQIDPKDAALAGALRNEAALYKAGQPYQAAPGE